METTLADRNQHIRHLHKQDFGPEEERAFNWFLDGYREALGPLEDDIEAWVDSASTDDLASLDPIRAELESRIGDYTSDFNIVFSEGGRRGAEAGRTLAARRHQLDVAFDIVPDRTLNTIDDWAEEAAGSTLETITEDSTRWLRGAHKEGLDIDEITERLNGDLFDGRLEDYVARRAARTGTIATSNTGSHSAYQDAESVIAEEWLATSDDRTRDSHAAANGQIVLIDSTFEVGGVYMDHPGDPSAPVGEIANCRCAIVPVFADDLTEDELETIQSGRRIRKIGVDETVKILDDGSYQPLAATN